MESFANEKELVAGCGRKPAEIRALYIFRQERDSISLKLLFPVHCFNAIRLFTWLFL